MDRLGFIFPCNDQGAESPRLINRQPWHAWGFAPRSLFLRRLWNMIWPLDMKESDSVWQRRKTYISNDLKGCYESYNVDYAFFCVFFHLKPFIVRREISSFGQLLQHIFLCQIYLIPVLEHKISYFCLLKLNFNYYFH